VSKLCAVQFIHPGGEHTPSLPNGRAWNRGNHRRTFLRCPGAYLSDDGEPVTDDLIFWGEWEPPVRIVTRNPNPDEGFPRFICEPVVELPPRFDGQQNTDPFVFGDRFLYAICQQHTRFGPTGMQSLARGSLILFGSYRSGRFYLDTLFVVDESAPLTANELRVSRPTWAPSLYQDMVLAPWHESLKVKPALYGRGRLYGGATFNNPLDGMYSVFPCLPASQPTVGFARPAIQLPDYITDTLSQGRRVTELESHDAAYSVWNAVVGQIRDRGLLLGIRADLPTATG
jgi:hypothetical protein